MSAFSNGNGEAESPPSRFGDWSSGSRRFRALSAIALLLPVAFFLYSLWPAKDAWWHIIDDHRKLHVLETEHGMPVSAIFRHFWHAVDFPPLGQTARVQPMFHVLWGTELRIFGLDAGAWYWSRIVCGAIFAAGMAAALIRVAGSFAAALISISLLVPSYHSQVFLRLGVAESYLAPALAIATLLAFCPVFNRFVWRLAAATAYAAALLVIFGTKEIGLLFVPLVAARAWLDARQHGWQSPRVIAGLAGIAFAAFVAVLLVLGLRGQTTDIYGQDLSILGRLANIVESPHIRETFAVALAWPIGIVALASVVSLRWPRMMSARGLLVPWSIAAVVLGCLYVASLVFYNFSIPSGSHYEFPARPLLQLLVLVAAASATVLPVALFSPARAHAAGFAVGAIVLLTVTLQQQPNVLLLRQNAEATHRQTSAFRRNFELLVEQAQQDPKRPVEFVSHGFNDFEPVHSLLRFLRGYGVRNPIVLNIGPLADLPTSSPWESYLRTLMLGIKPNAAVFSDVVSRPPSEGESLKVFFSQPELSNGAVANFWPL